MEPDFAHGEHNQNNISYLGWTNNKVSVGSKTLLYCLLITICFTVVEMIGGYMTHSVILQSDAVHMLTDAIGFLIAYIASSVSRKPANINLTFGYGNAEAVGALISTIFTMVLIMGLLIESIEHMVATPAVHGGAVFMIATLGLLVNSWLAVILMKGSESLNIKAALVHVMGDLLGSAAAMIAGLVIYYTNFTLIDPLLSLLIIILLTNSNYKLFRRSIQVLMAGVPSELNYEQVGADLGKIKGVLGVHDLHIWYMSANTVSLSAHIVVKNLYMWQEVLGSSQIMLAKTYAIEHITLQPEISIDYMGANYCESQ